MRIWRPRPGQRADAGRVAGFRIAFGRGLVIALLLTGSVAVGVGAAAPAPRARSAAVSSSAPCVLVPDGPGSCQSSDPELSLDFLNQTNTSGCTFRVTIDWGDGSPSQQVTVIGGGAGPTYLASHTYALTRSYAITTTGRVLSGVCLISSASYQFTLLPSMGSPGVPLLATSVELTLVSGVVTFRIPGSPGFALLTGSIIVPNGTDVDASGGRVTVTVATGGSPTESSALVYAGWFIVQQDSTAPYETHFVLSEPLTGCTATATEASAPVASAAKRKPKAKPKTRHLWASETGGNYGTTGRYVATNVEGTKWLTSDSCTTSTVLVTQGIVAVLDLVNGQTIVLHAHQHYGASKNEPQAGPLAVVNSYWAAIGAHAYARAYGYVAPGVLGSKASFVAAEKSYRITSVSFRGRLTTQAPTSAAITVISLITRDHAFGCRTWSGSYTMTHHGRSWLIALADVHHRPCR